jgi:hypothetical protein
VMQPADLRDCHHATIRRGDRGRGIGASLFSDK